MYYILSYICIIWPATWKSVGNESRRKHHIQDFKSSMRQYNLYNRSGTNIESKLLNIKSFLCFIVIMVVCVNGKMLRHWAIIYLDTCANSIYDLWCTDTSKWKMYRVISYSIFNLLYVKICVPTMSMTCQCHINALSGYHSIWPVYVCDTPRVCLNRLKGCARVS